LVVLGGFVSLYFASPLFSPIINTFLRP
jgi:hypothetical protein